jgi:hypothetical protein
MANTTIPEPQSTPEPIKIADVEIPIQWNQITIGTVKATIFEGDEVHIRSDEADEKFLIAEGDFEGAHYKVQSYYGGIEGAKKTLKEEIESCLKKTW